MGAGKSKPMGALQAVRPAAVLSETPISTHPSFKLILVRHGVSCANLKKAMGQSFSSYKDPELTRMGQEKAINRGLLLRAYLETHTLFNPIVAASVLMRAQQTALLMMSPDYRNEDYLEKIAIAPYVSEKGPAYWFQTDDNKPYRKEEQARILSIHYKTPALVGRRMYIPEPFPVDAQTPSPAKFIQWLTHYYATMSKVVPSLQMNESEPPNTRRPVILFTHGNYIQQFIKYVTKASPVRIEKSDRPNYSAFSFTVEMRPAGFHITYDGPVSYAAELDSNSELRYNESNTIDAKGECAGGGDRCISAACPPSATRIKRPLADILQEQAVMRKLAKNIATLPPSNAGIPQLTEANVMKIVKNSRQTPPLPNNGNNNTIYSVEEEEEEEKYTGGYRRKLKRKTHKRKTHKRKTHKRRR
jgi:bisphosphoglycerate-dependent phosphoglycerate mutase